MEGEAREAPHVVEGLRPDELLSLTVGLITAEPRRPAPKQRVIVHVPVHNDGPRDVADLPVELLVGHEVVASSHVAVGIEASETARLEWVPPAAGTYRLTARLDTRRLRAIESMARTAGTLALLVTAEEEGRPVRLRDVRWRASRRQIEVELSNDSPVPGWVPVILTADGVIVRRTIVGPIPPNSPWILVTPWPTRTAPGLLAADIGTEPSPAGLSRTAIRRDERADLDLRVEQSSLATTPPSPDEPKRLTASCRLVNRGRGQMPGPCHVNFVLRGESPATGGVHTVTVEALPPNGIASVSHTFVVPAEVDAATADIIADPDNELTTAGAARRRARLEFRNPLANLDRWVSIGPTRIDLDLGAIGRLHHVVIDPTHPETIYVASGGASGSGVWKTTDGGATWDPMSDGFGTPNIKALAMDPSDPNRLYALTTNGMLRTTNGGASWVLLSGGGVLETQKDRVLRIDPARPQRLYLTSVDGILRSTDRGETWALVLDIGRGTDVVLLDDDSVPRPLVAAIQNDNDLANTGVYRSDDGGDSWRRLVGCPGGRLPSIGGPTTIRLATSGSRVYASFKTDTDWTLYRTTGVGCTVGGRRESMWERGWRPTGSIDDDPIFKRLWKGIHADPDDADFVYAGGTDLWISKNGGESFSRTVEPHVDHQGFAFHPTDRATIFTASDGGLYRSTARGDLGTWRFISASIRNTEFYDIASAATDLDLVIGGTQDNGTIGYDAPSTSWDELRDGDGATVAIDPTDESIMYSMGQFADQIRRSDDGGDDWTDISDDLFPDQKKCLNLHFVLHPTDLSILLAPCEALWRLDQGDGSWQKIFVPPTGNVVRVAVEPIRNTYLAGTNGGEVYAGRGGDDFQLVITNPVGPAAVTDIELDSHRSTDLFVSFTGSDDGRVLQATRLTAGSYVTVDITGDLPADLSVSSLAHDRVNRSTLYAGTNRGVYRGRPLSGGTAWHWERYGSGLPDPDVRSLHAHPTTGLLRAGTMGRGAYEVRTAPVMVSVLKVAERCLDKLPPLSLRRDIFGTGPTRSLASRLAAIQAGCD